jgi:hypothetical protein
VLARNDPALWIVERGTAGFWDWIICVPHVGRVGRQKIATIYFLSLRPHSIVRYLRFLTVMVPSGSI